VLLGSVQNHCPEGDDIDDVGVAVHIQVGRPSVIAVAIGARTEAGLPRTSGQSSRGSARVLISPAFENSSSGLSYSVLGEKNVLITCPVA